MSRDRVECFDPIVLKPSHTTGLLGLDGLPVRGLWHDVDELEQGELLCDLVAISTTKILFNGLWADFGRSRRFGYWSKKSPANIRGVTGSRSINQLYPRLCWTKHDPVGPSEVSPPAENCQNVFAKIIPLFGLMIDQGRYNVKLDRLK